MTVEELVYTETMAGYVYFHDKSLVGYILNILASESLSENDMLRNSVNFKTLQFAKQCIFNFISF